MDFFKLTEDELYQVKEDFHDIWATQDTTFSGYLDNYIKGLSNMTDASQNAVDKVVGSVSDLSSSMENLAKSSKTTVADVSNSFNDLYNNEVWQGLTQEGTDYYTKMVQFQKDFKKSEDNKTLEKDASALKKEYLDAYKEAKDKYDSITSAAGTDTSEQSATANGISSISYEQASNIEGITTAINVEVSQSKDEAIKIGSIADETRTLIAEGHTELIGIHNDTSSIDKRIKDLASDVSDIKKNVKNM
jgi:methyl-accepting chemotaxis protein